MSKYNFGIISTNRATLKKWIASFRQNKISKETLYAPRPLPGTIQDKYYAILQLQEGSSNHEFFATHRSYKPLTKTTYTQEKAKIKYFWQV